MRCRYRVLNNQTIKHLVDIGLEEKTEIVVRCDGVMHNGIWYGEWHIREAYIDRHGKKKGSAVICMCPDYNERWGVYIKREYGVSGWEHVSLKGRRY